AWRRATPVAAARGELLQLSAPDAPATVLLRGTSASSSYSSDALLIALNPDLDAEARVDERGAVARGARIARHQRQRDAALEAHRHEPARA
ncbi:hypothetical protein, partial [Burkholderia multivorans]|uniref:hypothetical protein n=1 Tax=Burkholderia multivorans TaxID=87883 RepID=UPI0011B93F5E